MVSCMHRLRATALVALAATMGSFGPALAASSRSASFVDETFASSRAYLVDELSPRRVRVVSADGAGEGVVASTVDGRLVTLDAPISATFLGDWDSCGNQATQRRDTRQILFRTLAGAPAVGRSGVVEIGSLTNLDGCDVGQETPFGSLADPGMPMLRRALSQRAPMNDLVPGTLIAGLQEGPTQPESWLMATDVGQVLPGSQIKFSATGTVVKATLNPAKWWTLSLSGFERGYTRLSVDPTSGAERWLQAEFAGGLPVTVKLALGVKADAGASFGTLEQTSRMWESGMYLGSRTPFSTYLYPDGTGVRITQLLDTGEEFRGPVTWHLDGVNVVQVRSFGPAVRTRTWQPLMVRDGYRFVMESEVIDTGDGHGPQPLLAPRLMFVIDRGAAVAGQARSPRAKPARLARP